MPKTMKLRILLQSNCCPEQAKKCKWLKTDFKYSHFLKSYEPVIRLNVLSLKCLVLKHCKFFKKWNVTIIDLIGSGL